MNGSDRLRERAQRVREIRREALLGFGVGEEHDLGGQFITELADLAADLGDALRALYEPGHGQPHGVFCSCGYCKNAFDMLARLDAWGQE